MSADFGPQDRLARVELREDRARARTPEIQQELDVAMHDLGEDNRFRPLPAGGAGVPPGPYALGLGMAERQLALEVTTEEGTLVLAHRMSITPLRRAIKDYYVICESYYDAVKRLPPEQIEAIDMGRRGVHDEGARLLLERLEGRVETDHATARRLFTVICALQFGG